MSEEKLRQTQVIAPNGVGAIFDISGQSFVVEGTDAWFPGKSRRVAIASPRLSRALRTRTFYAPPVGNPDHQFTDPSKGPSLPVVRFPTWLFCGSCRQMVQWTRGKESANPDAICPACRHTKKKKLQLVPMRWVQICASGHLGDVDWAWYAHSSTAADCRKRDGLKFIQSKAGGAGLSSVEIRCSYCVSARSLADINDRRLSAKIGLHCTGRQPWEGWDKEISATCTSEAIVVQRRASNVYYPDVHSAIEVPFVASAKSEEDLAVLKHAFFKSVVDAIELGNEAEARRMCGMLEPLMHRPAAELFAIAVAETGSNVDSPELLSEIPETVNEIAESEWAAFSSSTSFDDPDFRTRIESFENVVQGPATAALASLVPRITLAGALREVRAFTGFRRVTPGGESDFVRADGRRLSDKPKPTWLPAIETRGEGIFLSLDQAALSKWETNQQVVDRVAILRDRAPQSFMWSRLEKHTGTAVSPRYVLLHTLAHLLIRRLAFESGYGATSLRERVFARTNPTGVPQFGGLLIYTAAGDAEGTLGGLVRQGQPHRLASTLLGAIDDAAWCSADPLCSEQESVSLDGLNLASCHACTLVSETSCENGNYLLDRALIVGTPDVPGFFRSVLDAAAAAAAREE
ncbi:hypothetical protein EDF18_0031 [Frigoribacterium sp. PhB107]|uniref:DUF1998 domain-containing protein n=1 Tax=Frigoribacterium sp. PhB107 TaxID=2485172 RepID=UPI000F96FFBB|nr:DUF1998 domain-containing protein [Frigoribacterium sp. PhB107]ROP77404.1 hypothetical protein EDF18_0031 [Frigoribacterium sp. PhB107]